MIDNPLRQYFRQPAIYIRLPSQGQFYPPGSLTLTPNSEYPVLPMTTVDEITYRTPDALFNGSAVAQVIQSCIPNIKNAWEMPGMDIDTCLVAIRVATYGHEMDITTKCPKCDHEADYALDLRTTMERIRTPDYDKSLNSSDLEVFFKPMNYKQMNDNNLSQFEEQKAIEMMEASDADQETKMKQLGDMLKKITSVTIKALAQSISSVKTPDTTVTDPAHITEWLANCDRSLFAKVRDHIVNTKRSGELPPLHIKCNECQYEYDQIFTLDMTSFFADAS
jgi:hypothetical protein